MATPADLWELPQPQLTSSIADKTEENFYSRCPPEKRPQFMNKETQNASRTSLVSASKDTAGDSSENEKQEEYMEKVCKEIEILMSQSDRRRGYYPNRHWNRNRNPNCLKTRIMSMATKIQAPAILENRNTTNRSSKLSSKHFSSRFGQLES